MDKDCPNKLNKKLPGKGKVSMVIVGTEELDVNDIDLGSISIAGVSPLKVGIEDVAGAIEKDSDCDCANTGPDGLDDLVLKFDKNALILALGLNAMGSGTEVTITLNADLLDGDSISGSDCVTLVGPPSK